MRIITHGDLQELGQIYCNKCHCLFGYNKDDLEVYKSSTNLLEYVLDIPAYVVKCPECGNVITISGEINQ